MPSIKAALLAATTRGVDSSDAQSILLLALKLTVQNRAWIRAHEDLILTTPQLRQFEGGCRKLEQHLPLSYLTGTKEFYGLDLQIDHNVLDPRPDTETLVDWALEVLTSTTSPTVADLGTGSGAIALAIQHQRPDAQVLAVDASADALAVAQANAERLQLPVTCHLGHWLDPLPDGQQDLIVSNPPYIAEGDPHLPALRHEPIMALTSGPDGLDAIRHIVEGAPRALRPGGWLLLEHGYDQGHAVHALLLARGFAEVTSRRDLGNHVRCTGGRWLGDKSGDNLRP